MAKILIPVDGSNDALQAVRHVVSRHLEQGGVKVHLLHVRTPFPRHVAQFSSRHDRDAWQHERAEKALAPARELLKRHAVPHAVHIERGGRAETIAEMAQRLDVAQILMGTSRKDALTSVLHGSVTARVLKIAGVPVEVIPVPQAFSLARYGLHAGIGAALAAVLVAAD